MNREIPETITQTFCELHFGTTGTGQDLVGKKEVKYIRKEFYDKAQARIKELEEALKNSLRCGWHSMEGSLDGTFDDLSEQEIRQFRKYAHNALGKESD